MSDELEDFCGQEFDRGLGRVWQCSLNYFHIGPHAAYPWHNVHDREPIAIWNGRTVYFAERQDIGNISQNPDAIQA